MQNTYMSEHFTLCTKSVSTLNEELSTKKLDNLKIPSDPSKVTVVNLWRTMNIITRIGRTFQKEDITKHPDSPFTDKIAIGRILSFLKYLEIVNESREQVEGEAKRIQKFVVSDRAQKFYYLLQDGRKEEALVEWSDLIKDHDLYKIITNELLSKSRKTTIRELQDVIWKAYGGKHQSSFYRTGAEFIAELLDHARLVDFNKSSGFVTPRENAVKEELPERVEVTHQTKVAGPSAGPDYVEFSYEGLYLKIKPDQTRVELAKGILSLLETQLQTKKEQPQEKQKGSRES